MNTLHVIVVVIYYFTFLLSYISPFVTANVVRKKESECRNNRLAMYNVTFVGNWSPDLFPKHYPEFRPPAQWSKTFGESFHVLFMSLLIA